MRCFPDRASLTASVRRPDPGRPVLTDLRAATFYYSRDRLILARLGEGIRTTWDAPGAPAGAADGNGRERAQLALALNASAFFGGQGLGAAGVPVLCT